MDLSGKLRSGAFDALSPDLLEHVFRSLCLHELLEGVSLVCKRFHLVLRRSATVWREIPFDAYLDAAPPALVASRLHSFTAWLAPRAAHVRRLQIRIGGLLGAPEEARLAAAALLAQQVEQAVGVVAPSLRDLVLDWATLPAAVGGWASRLVCLTRLVVEASEVTVEAGALEGLAQLSELELCADGGTLRMAEGAAPPPNLHSLQVPLPAVTLPWMAAQRSLRKLWMTQSRVEAQMLNASVAPLAVMTTLESLSLHSCGLRAPPLELTALTGLRELWCDGNSFRGGENALGTLASSLPRLAILGASGCKLGYVAEGVLSSTTLRVLYLESNTLKHIPIGAATSKLRVLSLDWPALLGTGPPPETLLAAATALRQLYICRPSRLWLSRSEELAHLDQVGRIVADVQRHASLRCITLVHFPPVIDGHDELVPDESSGAHHMRLVLALAQGCVRAPRVKLETLDELDFVGIDTAALSCLDTSA